MNNPTVIFDPYAAADLRNMVQTIVCNHNIAITGQAEWYPVAFFLKDENGEVLGGLLESRRRLQWGCSAIKHRMTSTSSALSQRPCTTWETIASFLGDHLGSPFVCGRVAVTVKDFGGVVAPNSCGSIAGPLW